MEKREKSGKSGAAQGILRVDASKSRIAVQSPGEPSSPQPSVDRLSVSFAPDYYDKSWDGGSENQLHGENLEGVDGAVSEASVKVNVFNMAAIDGNEVSSPGGGVSPTSPGVIGGPTRLSANLTDEDDDYSASMNVILQRRASQRKVKGLGKRRTSSPYDSDRRRSSVFTTSSGETAITMEGDAVTQEQIFENIRLHKELMDSVKQQPWDMRRKLKLVWKNSDVL
ncbi:unnamed protein product [Orchesella dallaii]|uniref:Uncharacterized protein n=1 Tax=Orchesella dallaii TaxID=48710 RepID=A0ABP1PQ39_9HEXA